MHSVPTPLRLLTALTRSTLRLCSGRLLTVYGQLRKGKVRRDLPPEDTPPDLASCRHTSFTTDVAQRASSLGGLKDPQANLLWK